VYEPTGEGGSVTLAKQVPEADTPRNFQLNLPVLNATPSTGVLGAFTKLRKASTSFVMSVCTVRPPAWNNSAPTGRIFHYIIFEYFSEICPESSRIVKIRQKKRALYLKTNIHFSSYLAQFFLE
jgi:hypothetical protein